MHSKSSPFSFIFAYTESMSYYLDTLEIWMVVLEAKHVEKTKWFSVCWGLSENLVLTQKPTGLSSVVVDGKIDQTKKFSPSAKFYSVA